MGRRPERFCYTRVVADSVEAPLKYLLLVVIVVLLFGGSRLPRVARGLGEGIRNFKDSFKGDDSPPIEKQDKPPRT